VRVSSRREREKKVRQIAILSAHTTDVLDSNSLVAKALNPIVALPGIAGRRLEAKTPNANVDKKVARLLLETTHTAANK
jgi:hypothetical protein